MPSRGKRIAVVTLASMVVFGCGVACDRARNSEQPKPAPSSIALAGETSPQPIPGIGEAAQVVVTDTGTYVQIQSARATPGPEFDALFKASGEAYEKGDYKTALAKAEAALAIGPDYQFALMNAATSACKLKDSVKANAYAKRLKGIYPDVVGDICIKSGVTIEGWKPMDAGK